jgi:cell division protein FtsW
MNRKIPYDKGLLITVLLLLAYGLVMVFSASSVISSEIYGSPGAILVRQLLAVTIGLGLLLMTMQVDYRIYQHHWFLGAAFAGTAGLLIAALLSPGVNGAHRWVNLGALNFQPSELAKLVVILMLSAYLIHRGGQVERLDLPLIKLLSLPSLLILLVLVAPDLGTALILVFLTAFMLFLGGLSYRYFAGALLMALPALYFLILSVPYRRNRMLTFLDAGADPLGAGYQIRQSLIAVGSGGITGMGYAQGTQKLFYLPEPHTDFIFALIAQELGFLGAGLLVLLFGCLFWFGARVALRADTLFGAYLGLGIVASVVVQAMLNVSVVLSVVPTKGIPLPFVSAGGSSMLMTLCGMGILLNISKHSRGRLTLPEWRGA